MSSNTNKTKGLLGFWAKLKTHPSRIRKPTLYPSELRERNDLQKMA
jgi:hypothetical protein